MADVNFDDSESAETYQVSSLMEDKQKRKFHNNMERVRRCSLSNAFQKIRQRHPWLRNRKASRLDVLRYTAEILLRLQPFIPPQEDKPDESNSENDDIKKEQSDENDDIPTDDDDDSEPIDDSDEDDLDYSNVKIENNPFNLTDDDYQVVAVKKEPFAEIDEYQLTKNSINVFEAVCPNIKLEEVEF